jgi:hypothetical protein
VGTFGIVVISAGIVLWSAVRAATHVPGAPAVTQPANLKPVEGAFGYKLGDKVPKEIDGFETANLTSCPIHPNGDVPLFTSFYVDYLNDGRICGIVASVKLEHRYEVSEAKDKLSATLIEKYGFRGTGKKLSDDAYFFGTEQRGACLQISDDIWVRLEYYDDSLRTISLNEFRAKQQKEDADQKSALGKNL